MARRSPTLLSEGGGPRRVAISFDHYGDEVDDSLLLGGYPPRMAFDRIKVDPKKMGGVPIIRNLRMPVATIVNMVADGRTSEQILRDFPELEAEDIKQALQFAAAS